MVSVIIVACILVQAQSSMRKSVNHQHQLIMPPISKDCSNIFLERSFIYAAPCEWKKLSECIRTSSFVLLKQCYLHNNMGVE